LSDVSETVLETETAAPPRRSLLLHLKRLLPCGVVLLAATATGVGVFFGWSAQRDAARAAELEALRAEVTRLKGMLAGYDRLALENRRRLEEEQSRRIALENRLAMAQAELKRTAAAGAGNTAAAAKPAKAIDCTVRPGGLGKTLKECLAEFNRP
jgi:hypothetical protein